MTARTAIASTVHEPVGRPGGPGLWGHKGWQLPAYIQHVANELRKQGHPMSQAIEMAVGIIENWKNGHDGHGHKVSPEVQAAAAKAWAQWEALKARAHASRDHAAEPTQPVDLALAYDEGKHPRVGKGQPGGGRFARKSGRPTPTGSVAGLPPNIAAQVRAWQRSHGLKVTGEFDTATMRSLRPASKGAARKATAAARKAKAAERRRLAAIARVVNRLSPEARAAYRKRRPTPPAGYVWSRADKLVRAPTADDRSAVALVESVRKT